MAYAQPAYRFDAYPEIAEPRGRQARVRAVRTGADARVRGAAASAADANASLLVTIAKLAAVVLVVVAALCFARIALTNATVTTMIESDALSSTIAEARSSGVGLEMEQSVLSSTSALNAAVKRLGMGAPGMVGTLALDPDIVAINADGELSLSDSVKNVVSVRG